MAEEFRPDELYRFENVVLDVARQYGNESDQAKAKIKRLINRAATLLIGDDRNWSWLYVKDSFNTSSGTEEYSLNSDVRDLLLFWKEGSNRGILNRIPSAQFRKYVPDTDDYSGVPSMWDERGVDSGGSKVISLFPVPNGTYEIFYQYYRHLNPIRQDQQDLRSYWGMPPNVIECLIQMATALTFKGIDDDRYQLERGEAQAMIDSAYGADQKKGNTRIRTPGDDPDRYYADGPMLPPTFGT